MGVSSASLSNIKLYCHCRDPLFPFVFPAVRLVLRRIWKCGWIAKWFSSLFIYQKKRTWFCNISSCDFDDPWVKFWLIQMSVNFPILFCKIALVLTIACELSTSTILLDISFIVILIVRCSIAAKYFKDSMLQMILLLVSLNFAVIFFSVCCWKKWVKSSFMCSAIKISLFCWQNCKSFELSISKYSLIYIGRFTNLIRRQFCILTSLTLS